MSKIDLTQVLNQPFSFDPKPAPLPADLRTEWRLALVLCVLFHCRAQSCSLSQLHALDWATRSVENRKHFCDFLESRGQLHVPVVRFDPALDLAVQFAIAEGLLQTKSLGERKDEKGRTTVDGLSLSLTAEGKRLAQQMNTYEGPLASERQYLASVARACTKDLLKTIFVEDKR